MTVIPTAERALRPTDALRAYHRWADEHAENFLDYLFRWTVAVAVAVGLLHYVPEVSAVPVLVAGAAGGHLVYLCHRDGPQGAWTVRSAAAMTIAAWVLGWASFAFLGPFSATLVGLVAAEAFTRRPPPRGSTGTKWWSQNRLVAALKVAGVLKADDDHPPLQYVGKPRRDAAGEWVTVELPGGYTWQDVRAQRSKLASAMHLPERRLHVEHDREHTASAVTLAVLAPPSTDVVPAVLPERWDWTQGVPLGNDRLGRPVTFRTGGVHTAIVAATGAGKTALVRYLLAHAALDPRVPIFAINGKDDVEDLEPIAPLCVRYAGGASRTAVADADAILREVEALAAHRNRIPKDQRFPVVLLIDEWFRLRGAAKRYDAKQAQDMDALKSELDATVRAAGIHVIVVLQKGTAEYLPKDQSVNYMQKMVGMCETANEARYVLDHTPEVMPEIPGEFLLKSPGQPTTLLQVPFLDDDAFQAVCARAADLRADEPHPPLHPTTAAPAPVVDEDPDDLVRAVRELLTRRGPMSATALLAALPEEPWRPKTAAVLGKRLAAAAGVSEAWDGNLKRWKAAPLPRRLPTAVPAEEHPVPPVPAPAAHGSRREMPAVAGFRAPELAPTGTDGAVPAVLKAVP